MKGMLVLWQARTPRERWLLGVMLALLGLVVAWLLILRPLGDMLSAAKERHGLAVEALAEARAQAAAIATLERVAPRGLEGPIEVAVGQSAAEAGFQLSRLQPQGSGRVSIAIGAARGEAVFAWVARLEAQGYVVETLSATANPDRTLAVQMTLRTRAG